MMHWSKLFELPTVTRAACLCLSRFLDAVQRKETRKKLHFSLLTFN